MIKVKFVDFFDGYDLKNHFLYQALLRCGQEVSICDSPDYLICSVFGHEALDEKYNDCIKILYTGENLCPDFNLYDYAIGFEHLQYEDRYFRMPNYYNPAYKKSLDGLLNKEYNAKEIACEKTEFCSFVYSNANADPIRSLFFDQLSKYKKVNSGGKYLNNIGIPEGVRDKLEFQRKHKFAIAFENSSHSGYTTEKLIDAFGAHTIPIYWGDPSVKEIFNEKAFVFVNDYKSLNEVIERVIEIDQNDEIYMNMLCEPAVLDKEEFLPSVQYKKLNSFIKNIVLQPKEEAYRRNRTFWGERYWRIQNQLLDKDKELKIKQRIMNKLKRFK